MVSFDKKDLQNKEIPSVVKAFLTEDMHNYIVILDGHIVAQNLSEEYKDITIEDASKLSEEFVKYYESDSVNSLTSESIEFNKQNTNSGLFIRAKRNKTYLETLHVFYVQVNNEFIHNSMIVLEENSQLKYFEYLINSTDSNINFVSNTFVLENATIDYSGISRYGSNAEVAVTRNAFIKRYGNAHYSIAEINDSNISSLTNIMLQEEYASGTSKTVAITSDKQIAKFIQLVEHKAKETEGYIENYGVANNDSQLVFEGIGKINKDMKRSTARQSNRGIVLGVNSRLDANPLLLIDEYDVIASHGAAIGKMDEEQLYYLMSRGITLKNAERLIISGFLSPVLEKLTTDQLKEDFIITVENKTL